jgi:hypothetical protein
MTVSKVSFQKRDLQFAAEIAAAEKYHLLTFSDGANSADHLIRVVELENSQRTINKQLRQF